MNQMPSVHEKRSRAKKGGSASTIATEASGLVVPWAILLAKQALQGMMDGNKTGDVGIAKSTSKSAKPQSAKTVKSAKSAKSATSATSAKTAKTAKTAKNTEETTQRTRLSGGGNCSASHTTSVSKGGSSSTNRASKVAYKQYNELASKIQDFLSRY